MCWTDIPLSKNVYQLDFYSKMNLNTSIFRRHSTPIVVIFLSLTVFTITIFKYQNEAFKFYYQANNGLDDSSEMIMRQINIFGNIEEKADKNTTVSNRDNCETPPLKSIYDFFDYGKKEKFKCKNLTEVGGSKRKAMRRDGSKFVCFDDLVPGDCIVLSFGINNEWSFDDAMYRFGCVIYAFDPTMRRDDFDRTPGIHFFNLGLSDFKGNKTIGRRRKNCKVDTYENILKKLNLTDKKIDYLKMDIEGSEIQFFEDVFKNSPQLLDNVKQMGVEIHPWFANSSTKYPNSESSTFNIFWTVMKRLECQGFKLLNYEANRVAGNHYRFGNRTVSTCYEIVWIQK